MDVFHTTHCLVSTSQHINAPLILTLTQYIIRQSFMNNATDGLTHHTSHCLEYIRHYLMCNIDITLSAMDKNDPLGAESSYAVHHCRDYDAAVRWTEANQWKGLPNFVLDHNRHHHHNPPQ